MIERTNNDEKNWGEARARPSGGLDTHRYRRRDAVVRAKSPWQAQRLRRIITKAEGSFRG